MPTIPPAVAPQIAACAGIDVPARDQHRKKSDRDREREQDLDRRRHDAIAHERQNRDQDAEAHEHREEAQHFLLTEVEKRSTHYLIHSPALPKIVRGVSLHASRASKAP